MANSDVTARTNTATDRDDDWFEGRCWVCGHPGRFERDRPAIGASYPCGSCGSPLKYQGQARVLVRRYATAGARCLAELAEEPAFADLRIWEPGHLGNFRTYLRDLPGYTQTSYWPAVEPGTERNGVRCEDLMGSTFASGSFDLVITTDVFEHVRHPYDGFAEVHRVLRRGGAHVFHLPIFWPLRDQTRVRVDTSGADDVMLVEPRYHKTHLVYNDFGQDLVPRLEAIGFDTEVVRFPTDAKGASRLVTFDCVRRR